MNRSHCMEHHLYYITQEMYKYLQYIFLNYHYVISSLFGYCITSHLSQGSQFDSVIVAYENEENTTLKAILKTVKNKENLKIGIIIGPEGGIDRKEVEKLVEAGAKTITLGKRILRTETVGLVMTSIIMYELE